MFSTSRAQEDGRVGRRKTDKGKGWNEHTFKCIVSLCAKIVVETTVATSQSMSCELSWSTEARPKGDEVYLGWCWPWCENFVGWLVSHAAAVVA